MDAQFPRWVALKDVRPFDIVVIREQCVTVSHLSEPDLHRRNVSGTILSKLNTKLFGVIVQVPESEEVLLIGRSTRDRSWTPQATPAPVRPSEG